MGDYRTGENYTTAEWMNHQPAADLNANVPLEGTEKQITWARDIRDSKLTGIYDAIQWYREDYAKRVATGTLTAERMMESMAKHARCREVLLACNSAKWWIDNRTFSGTELLRRADGLVTA